MNYVAAMLLLCLDLSEERAFWVMVALIDDNGLCCPCIHLFVFCADHVCHAASVVLLWIAPLFWKLFIQPPISCIHTFAHVLIWLVVH